MSCDPITTHVTDAKNRLAIQYKGSLKIEGIIEALTQQIQDGEDDFIDLCSGRTIGGSIGIQLDRLGALVGIERMGLSDDDYRVRITTKIAQNISQGEPERLIDVYKQLLGASFIFYADLPPGGVEMSANAEIPSGQVNTFYLEIAKAAPAGVRIDYLECHDPVEPFAFDGTTVGEGFGSTLDPLIGGKFAKIHIPHFDFAFGATTGVVENDLIKGFGTLADTLVGGQFEGL